MPILVDFNQIAISSLMAQMGPKEVAHFKEEHVPLLRHIILNSLRANRMKFHSEFGELIICTDNKSWRKEYFPHYKARRHTDREESDTNWTLIFDSLYDLKRDLEEAFPYKVMSVPGAEADDIIAVLCKYFATNELNTANVFDNEPQPVLILSGDKDFYQLQRYSNVKQYSPILKKWVKGKGGPDLSLREHIIRGDVGDGVPNFRSPDDAFVANIRQKAIMEKRMVDYLHKEPAEFCESADELRWFERNRNLIDLRCIPEKVQLDIMERYHKIVPNSRRGLLDYFIKHRMRNMIEVVGDF